MGRLRQLQIMPVNQRPGACTLAESVSAQSGDTITIPAMVSIIVVVIIIAIIPITELVIINA